WASRDQQGVQSNVERAIRITALLSYPCAIGLCVLAAPILNQFYGGTIGNYGVTLAAPLLQVLSITLIFSAMCTPLGSILQAMGRPDLQVKVVFGGIILKSVLNYLLVGIPSFNINGAPVGTFACFTFIFFCELTLICRIGKIRLKFTETFFKPLLCAVLCGAAAWAVHGLCSKLLPLPSIVCLGGSIAFAGCVYLFALLLTRSIKKDDILSFKKGKKLAELLEKWRLIG
ncbi:MAG: polysaccharide biosynthesis C-terminal domain-containing protein, partial [Clostridia bacterium]|nr:polysaccharide biosynthesis C-terminal domain-containing protein [Clostridia bacterium]